MISVNQSLCENCGVCVDECPTEAITLTEGNVLVDTVLCDGCGSPAETHTRLCVEVCPNKALTWVIEHPTTNALEQENAIVVIEPSAGVVPAGPATVMDPKQERPIIVEHPRQLALQHRALLPAIGGALVWFASEIVPRLVPLALDTLERSLDRPTRTVQLEPGRTGRGRGRGRGRRHRRRRG
jgi:Pyruvate/2-oxoacid:ferredoxin oxidoreductase delta subunit